MQEANAIKPAHPYMWGLVDLLRPKRGAYLAAFKPTLDAIRNGHLTINNNTRKLVQSLNDRSSFTAGLGSLALTYLFYAAFKSPLSALQRFHAQAEKEYQGVVKLARANGYTLKEPASEAFLKLLANRIKLLQTADEKSASYIEATAPETIAELSKSWVRQIDGVLAVLHERMQVNRLDKLGDRGH